MKAVSKQWVVEVKGLSKRFGSHDALKNVAFELRHGEFLTIFGPNGAGKTTLIRILATIAKPSSGEVMIAGYALDKQADKVRPQIGVIAHQTFLYEDLTAAENLRFYGKLYNVQGLDGKIDTVLEEIGLRYRRDDRVRTFSRGMQQRLTIARAMLNSPIFLMLDEPYTGLDPHASELLSSWLKKLHDKERTILMVTHDLDRGIEMADRIAVLNQGQIVFEEAQNRIDRERFRSTYYSLVNESPP